MVIRSVKELLTELKNISVLALDLAYCAVFFKSKEIAKEVLKLEEKADFLREEIEKSTLRAAKHKVDEEALAALLRLASYSERITDVTAEIVKEILEGKRHEIEKKALRDAKEKFFRKKIGKNFSKKKVGYLEDKKNIDVLAIQRDGRWIYKPKEKFTLEKNDLVIGVRP